MTKATSARQALRAATAAQHERVDRAFELYDLSDRRAYGDFLLAQAGALMPTEAALDASGVAAVLPDWPQRRRAHLLAADLAELELGYVDAGDGPAFGSPEEVLGAVYVLEGSRLGGGMLVRAVPPELPRRFLGDFDSARWRALIETLDIVLISDEQRATAVAAADRVFALFESGAKAHARMM